MLLRNRANLTVSALVLALAACLPSTAAGQARLFQSVSPLSIRIEAPFHRMISEKEGRFAARMILTGNAADTIGFEISPRGKSRMVGGICNFTGFMLYFSESEKGNPFEGQHVLPVVSHCKDRDSYEDLVLLEYLAYRILNSVTDMSLRVRLAHFEYYDSERARRVTTRYGFFLENWDDLAARKGLERLDVPRVPPLEYEYPARTVFEVFQYLIGNTDWSYSLPAPDERFCCHNTVPIGHSVGPVYPLPFDFDQSGLVDAPYATVDPSLPIRNVRERLFRGVCGPLEALNAALGRFEAVKPEILSLFEVKSLLSNRARSRATQYIEDFYRTIADDRKVNREMVSKCRSP